MSIQNLIFVLSLISLISTSIADNKPVQINDGNPNVWNFQIATKVIAEFQFNGMGMSIWENQGVENTSVISRKQFYVTPITEFVPNDTKCENNPLTGAYFVSYNIQVWNNRIQLAALDRLKRMQINVEQDQVQPLPFYQVRVIWNNAEQKLQKAKLTTTWNSNLQQQSIHRFTIVVDDKATCDLICTTLLTQPEMWTDSIVMEYSLSAAKTASRTLSIKTEHFLNSQLMASLKNMGVQSPERYLTSDDANRLSSEIMDNVVASQVVEGEYVPDADQLTLKDIVNNALQLQNVDVGNFSQRVWDSVFWDPVYARPDKVTSYLNKILNINQGNHTVTKSSKYSDKSDDGIDFGIDGLTFGGKSGSETSGSASFSDLQAWFLLHNYDVEIKGEIFIPKNLTLHRLNLGVLNRQETIFTKSVQMHEIKAPGTLKVTVGSKSIVESEDIKELRQRLDSLEPRVGQLEPRTTQLEKRVGVVEPLVANATTQDDEMSARITSVSNTLGTKIANCVICQYSSAQGLTECSNGPREHGGYNKPNSSIYYSGDGFISIRCS